MRKAKIAKYQHEVSRNGEWFVFAVGYLSAAKCLAERQKDSEESIGIISNRILLIPCLYNLRHGIELLLKYFTYTLDPTYKKRNHDIEDIFERAREYAQNADENLIQRLQVKINAEGTGISKKDFLLAALTNLESLIRKYRGYGFLSGGLEELDDKQNEVFRYPVNTDGGCLINGIDTLLFKDGIADQLIADVDMLLLYAHIAVVMFQPMSLPYQVSFTLDEEAV